MENYDPVLLKTRLRTSAEVGSRLNTPGHRPTKRKYLVLAAAVLIGLALVKTTVWGAFYQPVLPTGPQGSANFTVNDPNDPGDETQGGFDLLGGVLFPLKGVRLYTEARVEIGGDKQVVATVGVRF